MTVDSTKGGAPFLNSALLVNGRVFKAVRFHDVDHEGDEAVHVLARGHARPLALIGSPRFDLFLARLFAVAPKCHGGFARFGFIVR